MECDRGQDDGGLPAGMEDALRRLDAGRSGARVEWGAVDAAVMGAARARLGARRSGWRLVARVGMGMAAAACVVVGVWVGWGGREERLDLSRGVTMVDALRLSRLLEGKRGVSKTWDVNGDGVVDERDVEGIARRAVRVGSAVGWREDAQSERFTSIAPGEARLRRLRLLRNLGAESAVMGYRGPRSQSLAGPWQRSLAPIGAEGGEAVGVELVGCEELSGAGLDRQSSSLGDVAMNEGEARLRRLRLLRNLGEEHEQGGEPGAALACGLDRLRLATNARLCRGEEAGSITRRCWSEQSEFAEVGGES